MRYTPLILMSAIAILLLTNCSTDTTSSSKSSELAYEQLVSGRYDSAIYYANQSLGQVENTFYPHFILAYSYDKQKDYQKAIDHYVQCLSNLEGVSGQDYYKLSAYKNLGRICKVYRSKDNALKYYQKALEFADSDSENAGIRYNIANVYQQHGEYEKAIEIQIKALEYADNSDKLRSKQAKIYNAIGILYKHVGDYDQAKEYFFQVTQKDYPEYSKYAGKAYHNIGDCYRKLDQFTEATDYYQKALDTKDKNDESRYITHMDLGNCYLKLNDFDSAIVNFSKAEALYDQVDATQENLQLFILLEDLHKSTGNTEKAEYYDAKYETEINKYLDIKEDIDGNGIMIDQYINSLYINQRHKETLLYKDIAIYTAILFLIGLVTYNLFRLRKDSQKRNRYKDSLKNLFDGFPKA